MSRTTPRTPITVTRTRVDKGGAHVPTREGLIQHRDYEQYMISSYADQAAEWSLKEKRARQHLNGHASHPEFQRMTPIQLQRFLDSAEAQFWLCNSQMNQHIINKQRIQQLLDR